MRERERVREREREKREREREREREKREREREIGKKRERRRNQKRRRNRYICLWSEDVQTYLISQRMHTIGQPGVLLTIISISNRRLLLRPHPPTNTYTHASLARKRVRTSALHIYFV